MKANSSYHKAYILYVEKTVAPTSSDIGYHVPTIWSDLTNNNAYILTDITAGVATWSPILAGTSKVTSIDHASSPYTILPTDNFISVDCSGGDVVLTLPSAISSWDSTSGVGKTYTISDSAASSGGTYDITVNRAGSDTITDTSTGETSIIINSNGDVFRFQAENATTWKVY